MSKKIAFIGAGSFGFTRSLVRDILSFEAFHDATIALMDIDSERLDYIYRACRRIAEEGTHAQLLARGGSYARLYHTQNLGENHG